MPWLIFYTIFSPLVKKHADSVGYFNGDEEVAVDARHNQIIMTACIFFIFYIHHVMKVKLN